MNSIREIYHMPYMGRLLCSLSMFIWVTFGAQAQDTPLEFRHYGTESGIAHSQAFTVLEDRLGFIWIGTERGLSRFDGHSFKNYINDPTDSTSLYDDFIMGLAEDQEGTIWLASRSALIAFKPHLDQFETFHVDPNDTESPNAGLSAVHADENGSIWMTSFGGGLSRFDPDQRAWRHFRHSEENPRSICSNYLYGIKQTLDGDIWVGCGEGVARINPESDQVTNYKHDPSREGSLPTGYIHPVLSDSTGAVWFGTDYGIVRFSPIGEQFELFEIRDEHQKSVYVQRATVGRDGILWIGTDTHGMVRYDITNREYRFYNQRTGGDSRISHNDVREIIEDRSGGLWLTTMNGISKADLFRKPFRNYDHNPNKLGGLSNNAISDIAEHIETGTIWFATGDGLDQFDPQTQRFTSHKADPTSETSIARNDVWTVYSDARGYIWSSSYDSGLDRMDVGTGIVTHYSEIEDDSTSFDGIMAFVLYEDSRQNLWVGSTSSLNRYDYETDQFTAYRPGDTLDISIRSILEDSFGTLWVGSEEGGLFRFDRDRAKFVESDLNFVEGMGAKGIFDVFEDSEGELWIGSNKGLHRLIRNAEGQPTDRFVQYYTTDGLSANGVVGILEDESGYLWVTTSQGLNIIEKVRSGNTRNQSTFDVSIRTLSTSDGLPSNTFYIGPTLKATDGKFYLGTDNGFTTFYPEEITRNPHPPEVVFTDFQLFNKSVSTGSVSANERVLLPESMPYTKDLVLDYRDRVFTIGFSALHFAAPEKNRYAYRLDGFDDAWTYVRNRNTATYTNLSPGTYTFRVKAANLDDVWGEKEATLKIVVQPPFWMTNWFRFLVLFVLAGSIIGFYRWKTRAISRRNQILEDRVARRTHDLQQKSEALQDANVELHTINDALNETNHNLEERTEELREALERNKEILGITAHDLKNPLGGMIGLIEMTLIDASELEVEAYRDESAVNLDMLKGQAERMFQIIHDLLDRYRSGEEEGLHLERVNLCDIVTTVIRWNQRRAFEKDIAIEFDWIDDANVLADPSALQRILDNLISNSIKYNRIGGMVSVKIERHASCFVLSSADEGQGLTDDDKQKVFQKLQRLSARPTAGEHSTGLGLHIVKQLVEQHGGQVGVDSVYGEGASFWFSLPAPPRISPQELEDKPATTDAS